MKTCGIIGGLGPRSTVDLFDRIVRNSPAQRDQDHLRIIIDNHPQIPDRNACLLLGAMSPRDSLIESIKLLQEANADFIICACNTAHIFLREIRKELPFDFLDIIEVTMQELSKSHTKKVGLISTLGTAMSGIYQCSADKYDISVELPTKSDIHNAMEAICGKKGVKAGLQYEKSPENKKVFIDIARDFHSRGVDTIIMGCTEVALCLDEADTDAILINPSELLARAVVEYAYQT